MNYKHLKQAYTDTNLGPLILGLVCGSKTTLIYTISIMENNNIIRTTDWRMTIQGSRLVSPNHLSEKIE